MISWLTASWTDDRSTTDSAESTTRTTPPPPHDYDPASAGSSDSEGASLAGLPRESFDTLQSNASTISAPWFDHAAPNHPVKVLKEGLPEATPWFSAATLDAPFPPPPPAPWFAEASMHSPVRVSSPTPAASSSQGYLDIPPAKQRKSGEDESDGSPPFFAAVATMRKPFRLRKSKKKVGNGNSAPKPQSFAPSSSARRYPVSEYAANTDSDTESCVSTKSEPVNLRKLTSRPSFGLFSLGLGLGARVQSIVPPPLPPRPPPPSSVATEDDDDPEIETDADSSFASSSTYTAPSPSRSVGSLLKKESLIFYSQKPPSPPATPLPSRSEKIMRSAVEQIGETTIMLSRLARSAKRTMEPSEAAEAIGRLTSVDAGAERSLLECVDRSVTRVEVFLQAVMPRTAAISEKNAGTASNRIVQREVDAEAATGDAPPAYTARAAEDVSLLPDDINVSYPVKSDAIGVLAPLPSHDNTATLGQPQDIASADARAIAAEVHLPGNVEQILDTSVTSPGVPCQPVLPVAAGAVALANVNLPQVVETHFDATEMLICLHQPVALGHIGAFDEEPALTAAGETHAPVVFPEQTAPIVLGSLALVDTERPQVVETQLDPVYTASDMSACVHQPSVSGITREVGAEPALNAVAETHAPAVSTEQVPPMVVGNDKSIHLDTKDAIAKRIEGLYPVNVSADTAARPYADISALGPTQHTPRARAAATEMVVDGAKEAVLHHQTSPLSVRRHLPFDSGTSSKTDYDLDIPVTPSAVAVPLAVGNHLPLARAVSTHVQVEEPQTHDSEPVALPLSVDIHLPLAKMADAEVFSEPIRAAEQQNAASECSTEAHLPLPSVAQRELDVKMEGLIAEETPMAVAVPIDRHVPLTRSSVNRHLSQVAPLSLTRYLPSFALERSDVVADAAMEICNLLSPSPTSAGSNPHVFATETEMELLTPRVAQVDAIKEVASAARHLPVATAVHRQLTADRESRAQIFLTIDQPPTLLARHVPVAGANEIEHETQPESVSEALPAASGAPEVATSQHPPLAKGVRSEAGIDADASVQVLDSGDAVLGLQTHLPCVIGVQSEHVVDAGDAGLELGAATELGVAVHVPSATAIPRSLEIGLDVAVAVLSGATTAMFGELHLPAAVAKHSVTSEDPELAVHAQSAIEPRELPNLATLSAAGLLAMHSNGSSHLPVVKAKHAVVSVDPELTTHAQSATEPRELPSAAAVVREVSTAAMLSETTLQLSRHLPAATAKHVLLNVDSELTVHAQGTTEPRQLAVLAGRHLPTAAAALREVGLESEALAVVLASSTMDPVNLVAHTPATRAARRSVELDAAQIASLEISPESLSLAHHMPTAAAALTDLEIGSAALVTSDDISMRATALLSQHRQTARATQYSLLLDAPTFAEKTFSDVPVAVRRHFPIAAPIRTDVADYETEEFALYFAAPTAISTRTVWPTATTTVRNVDLDLAKAVSPVPVSMSVAVASAKGLAPVSAVKSAATLGAAAALLSSLSYASPEKNAEVEISARSAVPADIAVVSGRQTERDVTSGTSSGMRTESAVVPELHTESNLSSGDLTPDVFDQMFSSYFSDAKARHTATERSVAASVHHDVTDPTAQTVRELPSTPSRPRKNSDRPEGASERAREHLSPGSQIPGPEGNASGPSTHPAADGDWTSAAARRGTTVRSRSQTLNGRQRPEPQPRTASDTAVAAASRSPAVRSRDRHGRSELNLSEAVAGAEVANRLRPFSISSADSTTAVVDGGLYQPPTVAADSPPSHLSNDHLPERQALPLSPPVSPMHKRFHSISSAGMSAASRVDSGISDLSGMASPVVRPSVVTKGTDNERAAAAVAAAVPVFLHLSPAAEAAAKGLEQEHQWSLAHHLKNVIISRAEIQAAASAAPSHGTALDLIANASLPKNTFAGYLAARNRSASAVMQTISRKSGEVQRSFDAKRSLSLSRDVGKARTPTVEIVAPHANDHDYDIENASPVLSPSAEPAAHASMLRRSNDGDSDRDESDDDEEKDTKDWLQDFAAFASVVAFALLVGVLQSAPLLARGPVFGPNVSTFAAELPLAALLITAVGSSPVWAWAAGIVGSPAPLTACVALFTLFIGLSAGSTDWNALIALAACAGLFAGGILPLSVLARKQTTTRTRHEVVSLVILLFAVVFGLTCGPIIGHALLLRGYDHWRWMFLIPALVALPGILFAAALLWKARSRKHVGGSTVDQSAPRMLPSLSSTGHARRHRGGLGLGPAFLLAALLTAGLCAVLWGGQYPSFGGAQAGDNGGGAAALQQSTAAGTPPSGLALDTSPNAHALHSPGWVQNANGQWTFAPGAIAPGGGGGTASGGTAPAGTAPGGTAPVGNAPGGTAPGGTAPAGTAPGAGGTAPGGTAPAGTAPGGTAPGGTAPAGTAPGGTAPAGAAPGGTAPGGTPPAGTAPGGTTPGGIAPGGATPGGAAPGGTAPGGVNPGGTTPGTAPNGVPPGTVPGGTTPGVAPAAGSSTTPSGTLPTAAPAPYPSSLGPGPDAPRNPSAILFQQLDQCRMPPSFNDLAGATSSGRSTDAPGPLLSKAAWAGLFSVLVIIALGTLGFLISSLFSGKHLAAVGTVIALVAGASGFAAFAAVARYPPLVIGTLACHPTAALTYVLVGAILACILMCILPHSKESHARSALPGSVIALLGTVLVAIDIGDGVSGIGFAILCFGTIVATASGAKSRNPLIGALVGIGFGVLFANTAFRAHAASQFLPFTASPLDAQMADAIGDGLHLVHRAVAVPLAALAVTGWASFAGLASRAH
ncbi:hypothetical protein HDU87_007751 [Geranomyces variabilis]|uniref:Uncharacterized protein n=1 Tax=Geranomyces variabilis TaxID=109894 RepID=A0AAD5TDJ9_9FUNG|nr:hypothetical protein HDU87_007751 [Geranomyces variabilis]